MRTGARFFLPESGFPRLQVSNLYSESLWERAWHGLMRGRRYARLPRRWISARPAFPNEEATARDWGPEAKRNERPQEANLVRRECRLAAPPDPVRPFTLRTLTAELAARGIKTDARAVWVSLAQRQPRDVEKPGARSANCPTPSAQANAKTISKLRIFFCLKISRANRGDRQRNY
jgi:hypothetical protein